MRVVITTLKGKRLMMVQTGMNGHTRRKSRQYADKRDKDRGGNQENNNDVSAQHQQRVKAILDNQEAARARQRREDEKSRLSPVRRVTCVECNAFIAEYERSDQNSRDPAPADILGLCYKHSNDGGWIRRKNNNDE